MKPAYPPLASFVQRSAVPVALHRRTPRFSAAVALIGRASAAAAAAFAATAFSAATASAQTTVTLDGTSGSNSLSTTYTLSGDTTFDLGFFAEYLIIGGGGGGAGRDVGGGGGAGGYRSSVIGELSGGNSAAEPRLNLLTATGNANKTYAVTVGAGGAGGTDSTNQRHGRDGGNSSFAGVVATGGGGARGYQSPGSPNGGSGGGGDGLTNTSPGTGAAGQGFGGGTGLGSGTSNYGGGGGGGAGQAGASASSGSKKGGDGITSSITGTSITRAGGGGGAGHRSSSPTSSGAGGAGGGGAAPTTASNNGGTGVANTGGGGGASLGTGVSGGSGGSGVVIVRYAGAAAGTGGTVSAGTGTATGSTLHEFTSTGSSNLVITDDFSTRLGATLTTAIEGSGNLTYSGPGRLTLAADSSYVGDSIISAGTLQVGNGSTTGSLGSGGVSIAAGSTLAFNRSNALVQSGVISGSGGLVQQGTGSLVLAADNTFAGTATISAGTLQVGNGGSTGSLGTASVVNNSSLVVNRTGSLTLSGAISGSGTLEQAGAGTTILTANNSYTGATTVSAGTLQVGAGGTAGSLGTDAVTLAAGTTLAFNRSDNISVINLISGDGGIVQDGAGDLTLLGNNTFTGGTRINNGVVVAGANTALGTGNVTIAGGDLRLGTGVAIGNQIVLDAAATPANTTFGSFLPVEYLVVGGGGGGAGRDTGGGGGGGGVLTGNLGLTSGQVAVEVGGGGAGGVNTQTGSQGDSSLFGDVVTLGGGGGGYYAGSPTTGGSGGGGAGFNTSSGAVGTPGQGFAGGAGEGTGSAGLSGGGGGAGAAGQDGSTGANKAGDGGAGLATTIRGTTEHFGGGGGGAPHRSNTSATSGAGGLGGGGGAATSEAVAPSSGTANTGGGGGASRSADASRYTGGVGGSGTVVLRYFGGPLATGGTITAGMGSADGFTIHSFNTVGEDVFVLDAPIAATISGSITGAGGFRWDSAGTLTLTGANDYAGGTTIAAGRLIGSVASLPGNITNNATVEFAETGAATYAGVVSGSGGFVKSGPGSLALTGSNTYTGASLITGGTLVVGNGATAGTLGGTGSIANAGVLAFNRSDSVTLGRAVSGSGSLVQQGSGTLILAEDNTHAGGTTVSSGTLQVGNGGATGSLGNGPVSVASEATLAFERNDEISVANAISGDGKVVKNGSNTLNFSAGNTYTGGTIINDGAVVAASSTALGSGLVTLNGGTMRLSNAVNLANDIEFSDSAAANTINGLFSVEYLVVGGGGGGAGRDTGGGGAGGGALTGSLDLTATSTGVTVGGGGAGGVNMQSGSKGSSSSFGSLSALGGGGGGYYAGSPTSGGSGGGGAGFNSSSGAAGTAGQGFAGGDGVGSGADGLSGGGGGAGEVGADGDATLNAAGNGGAGLATTIRGTTEYFGGGGGGAPHRSNTSATSGAGGLGGGGAAATSEAANPTAGAANTGGGGGASRSADVARYTGAVGGSGIVVVRYFGEPVATGGTIDTVSAPGYTIHDFDSVGTTSFDLTAPITTTLSGNLSGTGGFTLDTPSTLVLTGANTYQGETILSEGILQIGSGGTTGSLGSGSVTNNAALAFNRSDAISVGNAISGTGSLIQAGSGTTTLTAANSYSGGTTLAAGTLLAGDNAAFGTGAVTIAAGGVTLGTTANRTLANAIDLANNGGIDSGSHALALTGILSGAAGFEKAGAGTVTLTGANTYAGTTTISDGTLEVGNGGTTGTLGGGAVVNNATLEFNRSNDLTAANLISGTGDLTQAGSGTLTLTAANTFSGNTTISDGTLEVTGTLGNGSYAGAIANNAALSFSSASNQALSGILSGTGDLTQAGSGTLTLEGANTYSGRTTIESGTLALGANASIANSSEIALGNGARFEVSAQAGIYTVLAAQTLSGGGTVEGAITIEGTHTPGFSPGLQSFEDGLSYASGASFVWELTDNSTADRGVNFDAVDVSGAALNFAAGLSADLVFDLDESSVAWSDAFWDNEQSWLVFGSIVGTTATDAAIFDTVNLSADSTGAALTAVAGREDAFFFWSQDGNNILLNYSPVPEPASYAALFGLLALGLAAARRREHH